MRVRAWCCLAVALSFSGPSLSQERKAYACVEQDAAEFFSKDKKEGMIRFKLNNFTMVLNGKSLTAKIDGIDKVYSCSAISILANVLQCTDNDAYFIVLDTVSG